MKEPMRKVGKVPVLDGGKEQRVDGKGREPTWIFHWDLVDAAHRLGDPASQKLKVKWEGILRGEEDAVPHSHQLLVWPDHYLVPRPRGGQGGMGTIPYRITF